MTQLQDLLAQVDSARDDIIALEQALVRIPTVNTGFMPTGDESLVCEYVKEWLSMDGIECQILEAARKKNNHRGR